METNVILNIVSAGAGAAITLLSTFIVRMYRVRRQSDHNELESFLRAAATERTAIFNENAQIRADLQQQLLDMRKQILDIQTENLKYVRENAELRQQVIHLLNENSELKRRTLDLEGQVSKLNDISMDHLRTAISMTSARLDLLETQGESNASNSH